MVVVGHVAMGEIVTELKRILPEVHLTVNSETRTSNQVFELLRNPVVAEDGSSENRPEYKNNLRNSSTLIYGTEGRFRVSLESILSTGPRMREDTWKRRPPCL